MLSTQYRLRLEAICKKIATNQEVDLTDMIWAGKLSKAITDSTGLYGELSAATNVDDVDWAGKAGLKYTF